MLGASTLATAPAAAPVRHVVNIAEIVGKLGNVTGTTVFSDLDPDVQSFLEHLEYGRAGNSLRVRLRQKPCSWPRRRFSMTPVLAR